MSAGDFRDGAAVRMAGGVDQLSDAEQRLVEVLGLDSKVVTGVAVICEPGMGARIEWTSVRKIPLPLLVDALASVVDPPSGPESEVPC